MTLLAAAGWVSAAASSLALARVAARATIRAEHTRRACHELRGALSAIGLGLEFAGRGAGLSAARVRALRLELRRAGAALDDLAAGSPTGMLPQPVVIDHLLADSVEAWRPAAGGRPVVLELERSGGAVVHGDAARLAQATGNLIANAIEHGDGPVSVSARATTGSVRIEVCDRGPGLPTGLARLLGRRSRLALPRAYQARGHGLRIVDHVARSHGGRLEAAPSGGGARIVLELPLVPPEEGSAAASRPLGRSDQ